MRLWDASTGRAMLTLCGHSDGVVAIVFAQAGSRLASASIDGSVRQCGALFGVALLCTRCDVGAAGGTRSPAAHCRRCTAIRAVLTLLYSRPTASPSHQPRMERRMQYCVMLDRLVVGATNWMAGGLGIGRLIVLTTLGRRHCPDLGRGVRCVSSSYIGFRRPSLSGGQQARCC